jgi:1,4-alpha-glucan branching enzyme
LEWSGADRHAGIVLLYRDLIRLRRNWFDHTRGLRGEGLNVFHVNDVDKVIAYHRWEGGGLGDDVVVVLNFGNRSYDGYAIGFPREGVWRVRCNTDWDGYDASFSSTPSFDVATDASPRDGLGFSGSVGLGPYTAVILSQDRG